MPANDLHSSGTFYNSTANEIQIANIGEPGIEVYSPRDDSWHQVRFPLPLTDLHRTYIIQQGTDSFILIGGETNVDRYSGDIYLFYLLSVLKKDVPRYGHVAMTISKDEFACE